MASKMTLEDEHESDAKIQRTGAAAAVLLCTFWPTPSHASLRVSTRALRKRVLGAEHRTTLVTGSYRYLTLYLFSQGKYAEAEALGREVLGALKRVLGVEHRDTLTNESNLALSLSEQGKYAEA